MAEPLAHFRLDGTELSLDVGHVGAAHGELGLELRIMGAEAELDAAVGNQILDPGEQRVDMALAGSVGMEALQVDRCLDAAALEEARDDLGLEHPPDLARHAGG